MINLTKPLCFFDLETTGINIKKDRIIEISILKIFPNKNKQSNTWLINPNIPIPENISNITHITNEIVKSKPVFKEIAPNIINIIKDSDLAGYNCNRFDIPFLAEELLRNNFDFDFSKHKFIDIQVIFHKMEPRTLSAAYQYYCKKKLINSHSAKIDTQATYEILKKQIQKYKNIENNIEFLNDFCTFNKNNVDLIGLIQYNENKEEIFNFGKYKGKPVSEILKKDYKYYKWIQKSDFPFYTKKILNSIKIRESLK